MMQRRSAWCSQRSPVLELGMGWTREAERGTEGDGGRDGAISALNFDALRCVGAALVYGPHAAQAVCDGRPLKSDSKA